MTWDEIKEVYHYPCPCGDRFEISKAQLANYEDIATCPSCSLIIRVIYDPVSPYISRSLPHPLTVSRPSSLNTKTIVRTTKAVLSDGGVLIVTSVLSTVLRSLTTSVDEEKLSTAGGLVPNSSRYISTCVEVKLLGGRTKASFRGHPSLTLGRLLTSSRQRVGRIRYHWFRLSYRDRRGFVGKLSRVRPGCIEASSLSSRMLRRPSSLRTGAT
jgi:diphthamide biosynthesis protein 3